MSTIFDFISDILTHKKGRLLDNIDDEQQYIPFMVNRWISFYSPKMARLVNNTVNRWWPTLLLKQDHYKLLVGVIPQSSFKRIAYVKKVKPEEKEKDYTNVIKLLASNLHLSQREVIMYVEEMELDLAPFAKALKTK